MCVVTHSARVGLNEMLMSARRWLNGSRTGGIGRVGRDIGLDNQLLDNMQDIEADVLTQRCGECWRRRREMAR